MSPDCAAAELPVAAWAVGRTLLAATTDKPARQTMASPPASAVRPNLRRLRQAPTPVRPATDTAKDAVMTRTFSRIVADGSRIKPTPNSIPKSPVTTPTVVA
jgi:hypothetical protein